MKPNKSIFVIAGLLIIVFSLVLFSCATPIGAIRRAPSSYSERVIVIGGKIVQVFPIPFSRVKVIKIDDGTGSMYLLSKRRRIKYGAYMTFSGKVVVIGGKKEARNMERAINQISNFLLRNGLADRGTVRRVARVVIGFVKRLFNDKKAFVFFIEE